MLRYDHSFVLTAVLALLLLGASAGRAQTIAEIIDSLGDGAGNALGTAYDVATDADGNVYVIGYASDNIFQIENPNSCSTGGTPCTVSEIMDASGDGAGNGVSGPESIAVDADANVYVASSGSSSVHRIAAPNGCRTSGTSCAITQIIDATGDGAGNTLAAAKGIAVDGNGNVYVGGRDSSNVFKIATPGSCSAGGTPCTIDQILWFHGAPGSGNRLDGLSDVAVDAAGNVYASASISENAFKVEAPGSCSTGGTLCTITEIIDDLGDGNGNLLTGTTHICVDSSGNVYVSGSESDNVFKIDAPGTCDTNGTPCTVREIIDASGDGTNPLDGTMGVATDADGRVYVAGDLSYNVLEIGTPGSCSTTGTPCVVTQILDATGDGMGGSLSAATDLALDASGAVYVVADGSSNVFRIAEGVVAAPVPALGWPSRVALSLLLFGTASLLIRNRALSQ